MCLSVCVYVQHGGWSLGGCMEVGMCPGVQVSMCSGVHCVNVFSSECLLPIEYFL